MKTYCSFYEGYVNKIPGKEILVTLSKTIESLDSPFTSYMELDIQDSAQNSLEYEAHPLQRLHKSWNGTSHNFKYSFKTKPAPEHCFLFKVYLWNPNNQSFLIRDGKLSSYYYD
jgi:hypothetical protein